MSITPFRLISAQKPALLFYFLLAFFFFSLQGYSQTTSFTTGQWNTGGTWVGDMVPAPGADIVIAAGHTVTIDVNIDINSLTVESGASLIVADATGPFTAMISGDFSNLGTVTFLNGTGEVNVTFDNSSTVVISGIGTFTNFNDLSIDGTGNVINVNEFTVAGDFSIGQTQSNISFSSNNTNLTFLGNFSLFNSASFSSTQSTMNFDGVNPQTLDLIGGTVELNNIDFEGASRKTVNGNLTTNGGTVEVFAGAILEDQNPGNVHTFYNLEVNDQNALDLNGSTINFMGGEVRFGPNTDTDGSIDF